MKIFYKGKQVNGYRKEISITPLTSPAYVPKLIAQYKFDKSIYENLVPEFNAEFTNYKIVDEYLDTEDTVISNTETMMLMNYDAEPDEYGVLTTEETVENISTFSAENIVTRSIYSNDLPSFIKFGVDNTLESGTAKTNSLLQVLSLNTSNLSSLARLFKCCENVTKISTSNWDTSNVTNMTSMFYNCTNLITIDVSNFDTSSVTNMSYMFSGCQSLTSLDLSNFSMNLVKNIRSMFNSMPNLETLNISNWHLDSVTNKNTVFNGTTKLKTIYLNNSDANTINLIISILLSRSVNDPGVIYIAGVNDISQVNIGAAQAKYWNIIEN